MPSAVEPTLLRSRPGRVRNRKDWSSHGPGKVAGRVGTA
jgi:hypothetical protein